MSITTDSMVEVNHGQPHALERGLVRAIHICPDLNPGGAPVLILDVYLLNDGLIVPFFFGQITHIKQGAVELPSLRDMTLRKAA
jgi:hypothetical protein